MPHPTWPLRRKHPQQAHRLPRRGALFKLHPCKHNNTRVDSHPQTRTYGSLPWRTTGLLRTVSPIEARERLHPMFFSSFYCPISGDRARIITIPNSHQHCRYSRRHPRSRHHQPQRSLPSATPLDFTITPLLVAPTHFSRHNQPLSPLPAHGSK